MKKHQTIAALTLPAAAGAELKLRGAAFKFQPLKTASHRELSDCSGNQWHPEPNNSDGCSNSLDYPPEWESVPSGLFYNSLQDCCDFFRPNGDCVVYDVCNDDTTTSTTATTQAECTNNKWHADMLHKDGCTNSLDAPKEWDEKYFFDSYEECCDFFGASIEGECKMYNVCNEGSTPPVDDTTTSSCGNNKWYPNMETKDGCTNSDDIPSFWRSEPQLSFYVKDTLEECCGKFFVNSDCVVYNECEGGATSVVSSGSPDSPTQKPTNKPSTTSPTKPGVTNAPVTQSPTVAPSTASPTKKPATFAPSKPPTRIPTGSPTVEPIKYYVVFSTGICTPKDVFAPHWLKEEDFFTDYAECCNSSFNKDACLATSPTAHPTTSPSPGPTLHPTLGPTLKQTVGPTHKPTPGLPTAKPVAVPTKQPITSAPSKSPTRIPTGSPTVEPIKYYAVFSTGICTPKDAFVPYWTKEEDFFIDYTECCDNSWNKDACHAARPAGACCTPSPTGVPSLTTSEPSSEPIGLTNGATQMPTTKPVATPTKKPITSAPTTGLPTNSPTVTPIKYYAVFSTGICTPRDAFTPYWLEEEDFFTDYAECCNSSWNKDACLAKSPTANPTTSVEPTAQPTARPSKSPMRQPSLSPTERPTSQPTASPTSVPTSLRPTLRPTAKPSHHPTIFCEQHALWHPSKDYSTCTNSFDYDELWDSPTHSSTYLHATWTSCCEAFFESWGKECKLENICTLPPEKRTKRPTRMPSYRPTGNPTARPTSFPTVQPTSKPSLSPSSKPTYSPSIVTLDPTAGPIQSSTNCHSAKFHPSEDYSKCTNRFGYNESWDTPLYSSTYLHESSQGCCEKFFYLWGKDCVVEDICSILGAVNVAPSVSSVTSRPTTSPTSKRTNLSSSRPTAGPIQTLACEHALFHPSEDYSRCTNSFEYDDSWNNPSYSSTYLHESSTTCCENFFFVWGQDCVIEDICGDSGLSTFTTIELRSGAATNSPTTSSTNSPTACLSNRYHPLEDFSACTNSPIYPESWNSPQMRAQYLYEAKDGCCQTFFFSQGKNCLVHDYCSGTSITLKPPTHSPSLSPTETTCESRLYHPQTDFTRCSNGLDYPESWRLDHMKTQYMFETKERCCEIIFFGENKDCIVEDSCTGEIVTIKPPTKSPSSRPTAFPTDGPTTCQMRLWHPRTDFDRCTNDLEYPEGWNNAIEGQQQYLFDTRQKCCEEFFFGAKKDCMTEDSCTGKIDAISPPTDSPTSMPPTSSPSTCQSRLYHPRTDFTGCTNSLDYPAGWNLENMRQQYLFDNKERCCEVIFFGEGKDCQVEDSCSGAVTTIKPPTGSPTSGPPSASPTSCSSNQWHPRRDFTGCTNSLDYPNGWNGMMKGQQQYLFDSKEQCCETYFGGQDCVVEDACSGNVTLTKPQTTVPTIRPSSGPTKSTQSPTEMQITPGPTTNAPSKAPTFSPTETTSVQYFSSPSDGMCSLVDEDTPSWITTFFTDWSECCKAGWVYEKCMAEAPISSIDDSEADDDEESEPTSTTTSSTSTTAPVQYYSSPSDGMCQTVDKDTPSWINKFHTDWEECCKVGWVFEKCMAAAPVASRR